MTTAAHDFHPGNLVRARNREWGVQASDNRQSDGSSLLRLRPLGGADEDIISLSLSLPHGVGLFDHYPIVVVSLDYIKSERHREHFLSIA